jgi:hypothetical protein
MRTGHFALFIACRLLFQRIHGQIQALQFGVMNSAESWEKHNTDSFEIVTAAISALHETKRI